MGHDGRPQVGGFEHEHIGAEGGQLADGAAVGADRHPPHAVAGERRRHVGALGLAGQLAGCPVADGDEVGKPPSSVLGERVIAIIRNGTLRRFYDQTATRIETGDELIVVRRAQPTASSKEVIQRDEDD